MSESPLSEVCVCGSSHWHVMLERVFWCRRCGCLRLIFENNWRVPLDRVGDLPSVVLVAREDDELPTRPGTPSAKSRSDMQAVRESGVELVQGIGKPPTEDFSGG